MGIFLSWKNLLCSEDKKFSAVGILISGREKKFSRPEKYFSRPEKIFSRPEKIFSRPEKKFSRPETMRMNKPVKISSF